MPTSENHHHHEHEGHDHGEGEHDHEDGHGHDHAHGHGHGHSHSHSHAPASFGRAFAIGITLNAVFVVVEVVYGLLSNSLALVADAGHNLSDVLGLVLAWVATVLEKRAATERHTYGYRRSSILAALANAVVLLVSVGAIVWEALQRLRTPEAIGAQTIIWVALLGIVINLGTALMFMSGRKGDLNIRGAFVHMAADAAISAGVVVAGVCIMFTGWSWLDPVVSLVLSAIIIYGTWGLLRESINLSLDAVPEGIDLPAVREYLRELPQVADAHHLHIWGLSTTETALTVHLVLKDPAQGNALLQEINVTLRQRFRIEHATIQFEAPGAHGCEGKRARS